MKRLTILLAVWLTAMGAMAQTNLALGATTAASSANGGNTAAKAVDGDNGTRWESESSDDQWWSVDLGAAKTFDMIAIQWEGAYAKSFRIVAGNESDFSDAVTVVEKSNETLQNLSQTYEFTEVTARYVKFVGVQRATDYGYSFYEFAIYKKEAAHLASINLTAAAGVCRVGKSLTLSTATYDQYGIVIETNTPTYSVSPLGAGTFDGNTFTPSQQGEVTITATIDGVVSNAVTVVCHEGANQASAEKVIDYNAEATASTIANAFDGNEDGGECVLHANEGNQDYTVYITLDLGKRYDLKMVSLCFEGASSADYTIKTSTDNIAWYVAATVHHDDGINAWKDRILSLMNNEDVRYVMFESTRAATGYGVKVRQFAVYATATGGELEKDPEIDAQTGAYQLAGVLNNTTKDFFDSDNSTAYDLRAVTIPAAIVITAQNPNAMFIVTEAQKTMLSGTKNLVVKDGSNYTSEKILLVDGYDVNTHLTIEAEAVSYERNNGYSGLQTFVSPFSAEIPSSAKVYGFIDKNTEGLFFQETAHITAGTPYLIKGSTGISLSATNTTVSFDINEEAGDDATFRATYTATTAGAIGGHVYVLDNNNSFRPASSTAAIGAFRGYITSDAALSKTAVIFDETDGITATKSQYTRHSAAYNLNGQRVDESYRGIVIVKGKKVKR